MDHLAALPEEVRKLALDRFRLIQPHLEQDQSLASVARTAGISYRTAHRWVTQYRRFGLAALARKQREDRGERRADGSVAPGSRAHLLTIMGAVGGGQSWVSEPDRSHHTAVSADPEPADIDSVASCGASLPAPSQQLRLRALC
jgi:hypothetical protein